MYSMAQNSLSNLKEDLKQKKSSILSLLNRLIPWYTEFQPQLEDLQFYVENDVLGDNQPFLLTIWGVRLAVNRNEPDKNSMLQKILNFCESLATKLPTSVEVTETKHVVEWITEKKLIQKETIYWRDVNVLLINMYSIFWWSEFAEEIKKLRKLIHKWELGSNVYNLEFEWVKLSIDKWEKDDEILLKLVWFIRKIESKYEEEFKTERQHKERAWVSEEKDRQKIWATIMAWLISLKKVFKWSDFGWEIAILKDMIDNYQLWYKAWTTIRSPWWINLIIRKWEDLDTITEKLVTFISWIQDKNKSKFEESSIVDKTVTLEKKEQDKYYWTDVLAWIDNIQKLYPENEYPSIAKLKEMIENGELWIWSSLLVNVWPAILNINKTDNDKDIKNKILVFLWVLKQISSELEETDQIDDLYWRDILGNLKAMEEAYWDIPDYQMLLMTIEFWVLGTVRDFSTVIDWISLEIKISDSDKALKTKLDKFMKELQNNKKVKIDQQAMKKALERITQSEMENKRVTEELKKKIKELWDQSATIVDQQNTIKRLEDELKKLKNSASQRSMPTRSYNW